jgi:hypothetical protein
MGVTPPGMKRCCAFLMKAYNTLGFGLLEHVHVMSLEREILNRRVSVGGKVHFGPDPKFYRLCCPKRPSDRSAASAASG